MCADIFGYREDMDVIKLDVFGEEIKYRHGDVWSPAFNAFIEEDLGGTGETAGIGIARAAGLGPYFVTVSKTDVPAVKELKDMVHARGKDITVARIETEDAGSWRLYCVA